MAITIPELTSVSVLDDTDNIMLTHSNGNSEKISGSAFKADMIKNKIENNNGSAVSINAVSTIMATSTTVTGPELGTGGNIKILFKSAIAGVDTSTGLTLTYNGSPIAVKVGKDGALENFCAFEVSTGVYRYLQAYTTLELVYDGTQFVIVGNPVVLSDTLYCIRANGYQAVDTVVSNNLNAVTSNAVKRYVDGKIHTVSLTKIADSSSHVQIGFSELPSDATILNVIANDNNTYVYQQKGSNNHSISVMRQMQLGTSYGWGMVTESSCSFTVIYSI